MRRTAPAGQHGHTVIESLIAVAVVAVLATTGMPILRQMIDHRAVNDRVAEFRSAVRLARGIAQERGVEVSLCARRSGTPDDVDLCASTGKDWSAGWIAFVDDGVRGQIDDGDRILHVQVPVRYQGRVSATVRYFTFQRTGISLNAAARFTFLPAGAPAQALRAPGDLLVCVNKPGRARIVDSEAC